MKNIISIQGYKGVGKDTVATYINYILNTPAYMHIYWIAKLFKFKPMWHRWKITRYANGLKRMLAIMMNIDVSKFEDREFKEYYYFDFNSYKLINSQTEVIENIITDKNFNKELKQGNLNVALEYTLSIRQILQFFGTDIMRRFFGNKLWIFNTLNLNYNNLIIADQRFIIENEMLSNSNCNSFVIHITRNGYNAGLHASEKELEELLNNKKYDVLLENNGTLKDLFNQCKTIIYYYLL